VSCDSCMKSGFSGVRYKCLVCCDYDLCSACYEAKLVTSRHKVDHAMQCLLTKSDVGWSPVSYLTIAACNRVSTIPGKLGNLKFRKSSGKFFFDGLWLLVNKCIDEIFIVEICLNWIITILQLLLNLNQHPRPQMFTSSEFIFSAE